MFNKVKIQKISKIVNLEEEQVIEMLKNQAKYLKVNANLLLKSYNKVVLREIKKKEDLKAKELKEKRYITKNVKIRKYQNVIVELYTLEGFGDIRIVNYLKLNHNCTISRYAIRNFREKNGITRNG